MRPVIFVSPHPTDTAMRFAQALSSLDDVQLLGVFQQAPLGRGVFDDCVTTADVSDRSQLVHAMERVCAGEGQPVAVLGVEPRVQLAVAEARDHFGVPGPDVLTVERLAEPAMMMEAARSLGMPCAYHRRLFTAAAAWGFAEEIGLPIVLKPSLRAGGGVHRVDREEQLRRVLSRVELSPESPVLAEEFLSGEEYSLDVLTVAGEVRFSSLAQYLPGPMETLRNPHQPWVVVLPRELDEPVLAELRSLGCSAARELGASSGLTHMEWFRRPDRTLAMGRLGAHPPGAQLVKLMSYAYDTDFFRHWARATVDSAYDGPWEQGWAVGAAFFRGPGSGRVAAVDGLRRAREIMEGIGIEAVFPRVGAQRSDDYRGDGYAIVRHPRTKVVRDAVVELTRTVKVRYSG